MTQFCVCHVFSPSQNNMEQQYLCMTSGDSDVDTVMTWLSQLNVSASQHSMEVLYSGAIPRLVMEAAFRHTVTPAVSRDYLHCLMEFIFLFLLLLLLLI